MSDQIYKHKNKYYIAVPSGESGCLECECASWDSETEMLECDVSDEMGEMCLLGNTVFEEYQEPIQKIRRIRL